MTAKNVAQPVKKSHPPKEGTKEGAKKALDPDVGHQVPDEPEPVTAVRGKKKERQERKEVQQLLEQGRSKGYLTYDEVNDALPPDMVSSQQIDGLMTLLGGEEIDLVDTPAQYRARRSDSVVPRYEPPSTPPRPEATDRPP